MSTISDILAMGREGLQTLANRRIVVVGGGVAGLATAYYLKKRGATVDVLEREGNVGGMTRSSIREDRYIVEFGASSFRVSDTALAGLARELSIDPQIVGTEEVTNVGAVTIGENAQALPVAGTSLMRSPLLTRRGKLRAMASPLIPTRARADMPLASFVRSRLGSEVWERVVEPALAWSWGGDVSELELGSASPALLTAGRKLSSMIESGVADAMRAPNRGLLSFKWGMGTLTARLEEVLKGAINTHCPCKSLHRLDGGKFRIQVDGDMFGIDADAIVIAAPALEAAQLLIDVCPDASRELAAIPYRSLAVVHTSFATSQLSHLGATPEYMPIASERRELLGATRISRLFPWRCPSSEELISSTVGGEGLGDLTKISDKDLVQAACNGLRAVMGIEVAPRFACVRRWPRAIPQYTVGHAQRVIRLARALESIPGLFATGNYLNGISISSTIAHARDTANRVYHYVKGLGEERGDRIPSGI